MSTNPNVHAIADAATRRDIVELTENIGKFKTGEYPEERFKHYRLTRGVYGQRQPGVHMFRTKIPYGKLTADQLHRLADVSERYTNGNLHLTTRQNVQLHYVRLDDSPAIWQELAEVGITAREACGNTVRNLTASARAGIDPDELFDVSPYVHAAYAYFLRNPISQEMGRKIKPAFSATDQDSAFTYFHDFGFIPRIQNGERGFKVVIAGGLGAQAIVAQTASEFMPADEIIPFMEATIRVFDRYGEREKRMKARMKFLVKKLGLEAFLDLVNEERKALKNQRVAIETDSFSPGTPAPERTPPTTTPVDAAAYATWLATNVFEQKQSGFYGVNVKVRLGDIDADTARGLAAVVRQWAADDIRATVNQGFLLKFVRREALPHLFNELTRLGLADAGFGTLADITACPGTDTCNLGVTNSTGLAKILEQVVTTEYPELAYDHRLQLKISGCMNACGQHMAANIGLHGSSIKKAPHVIPAMQVVLGGGVDPEGKGFIADKVIKLPTRRVPEGLRRLLDDYQRQGREGEYFNDYYQRLGKKYFYNLLKSLADVTQDPESLLFDWEQDRAYIQAIGVGECAGVAYDMIGAIINDSRERLQWAEANLADGVYPDAIYHAYSSFVIGAKALLLSQDVRCNTHIKILADFDEHYNDRFGFAPSFTAHVLRMKANVPGTDFARTYIADARAFFERVLAERERQLDKVVVKDYYQA